MPTYQYKCEECGIVFERFQHFSEEPLKVCPECGGPVHRVIQPVGIIFKGSGFYVTDNRSSASSSTTKAESKTESKESSSSTETNSNKKED
ncbi:MAG: zinc ribbon domain-containing protein [Anaerolineae bacterium]|nr:zinc ribbon domain-containing protein [Anaerolineae bacterium]